MLSPAYSFARQFCDRLYEFQHVEKVQHLKDGYSPDALCKIPLCVQVAYLQNGYLRGYRVNKSIRSPRCTGVIVANPSSTCKLASLTSCSGNAAAMCFVNRAGETP